MEHFAGHLIPRVSILECDELNQQDGLDHFNAILIRNRRKIIRLIGSGGSEKMLNFLLSHDIRHLLVHRVPGHASSAIKEAIAKQEIDRVRKLIAPQVLDEFTSGIHF